MASKTTGILTIRLPNEVLAAIDQSAGGREYMRRRITYDVLSKHGKLTRAQVLAKYPGIKATDIYNERFVIPHQIVNAEQGVN